jgi:hypothetical protein
MKARSPNDVHEMHFAFSGKVKGILFALAALILLGSLLASPIVRAKKQDPAIRKRAEAGTQIKGSPVAPTASSVVNFAELARQEASRNAANAPRGPLVPELIHSPVTPPEVDVPPVGENKTTPPPIRANDQSGPNGPSPNPSSNFIGETDVVKVGTSSIVIPPDTDGAVGLTRVFVNVNNNYVIQNKTTGAEVSRVSMDTFWASTGATALFDPRIEYDPFNNRWLLSGVSNAAPATSGASIMVGISDTSDPSGTFHTYRFIVDGTNVDWADFPTMGFNKNWLAINVNMINISSSANDGSKCLVFDYPQLRANTSSSVFFTGTRFVGAPAVTYDTTIDTLYVAAHISSGGALYVLDTITGVPPIGNAMYNVGGNKTRTGGGWVQPSGQLLPQSAPVSGASICGATPCPLETEDAFTRSNPVYRNGFIYYAQTVGLPAGGLTHTAVQWTKIDTSGNFVEGGRIEDATATASNGGEWYAYPSIAVNKFNEILIGFSQFSSAQHPAAGYVFRSRVGGAVMGDPLIYKAGEDYYHKTFTGARNRWGDYSSTQVDPSDDTSLWTLQEYGMSRSGTDDTTAGSNSSRWSTWWASLTLSPTAAGATISGAVSMVDGSPLAGVTTRLSGSKTATTITDSNGNYRFDNVDTDNFYTVTPALANYHFSPTNRSFSLVGNRTDAVFTGSPDAAVSANAIDTPDYFVRQQYLDFLGREPDQNGFDYWDAQLATCNGDAGCISARRIDVSAAFFISPESQQTGAFVYGLYAGTLGRTPMFAEFMPDRAQVIGGANLDATKAAFADSFVQRAEFTTKYPQTMTRDQFVDALLQTMNARSGMDLSSLRGTLISDYDSGIAQSQSRSLVIRDAVQAGAFAQAEYNKAFVSMEYFAYLRRDPEASGYNFWLNALNGAPSNYRGMVCLFITSAEYQRRFGTVVTHSNAECGR